MKPDEMRAELLRFLMRTSDIQCGIKSCFLSKHLTWLETTLEHCWHLAGSLIHQLAVQQLNYCAIPPLNPLEPTTFCLAVSHFNRWANFSPKFVVKMLVSDHFYTCLMFFFKNCVSYLRAEILRWSRMLSDDLGCSQMVSDDLRWSRMISDDLRWSQMIPDDPRCSQMLSDALRWSQMLLYDIYLTSFGLLQSPGDGSEPELCLRYSVKNPDTETATWWNLWVNTLKEGNAQL